MLQHQRIFTLDFIRVLATLAVVYIHSSAPTVLSPDRVSLSLWLTTVWFGFWSYWAVPVFIMISGAVTLLLPPQTGLFFMVKKAKRLALPLFFWILVYAFFYHSNRGDSLNFQIILKRFLFDQPYEHLYFLVILLGMHLFSSCLYKAQRSSSQLSMLVVAIIWSILAVFWQQTRIISHFFWPYFSYFLLGSVLFRFWQGWPQATKIVAGRVAGTACFGLVSLLSYLYWLASTNQISVANYYFQTHFNPLLMLLSISIFIFGLYIGELLEGIPFAKKTVPTLATLTFGVYLLHPIILTGVQRVTFWPVGSVGHVLTTVMLTLIVSSSCVFLLKKISIVKYFV